MENIKKQNIGIFNFRKRRQIPKEFIANWKNFVFDQYFPFIFQLAEKAHFENYEFKKKGVVPFNRYSNRDDLIEAIEKKKILVSLYKAPEWFVKTYHQLNNEEKRDSDLSDYLFICYNPAMHEGAKVTVSLHVMKKSKDVLKAELDSKKPLGKMTVIGTLVGLISLGLSVVKLVAPTGNGISLEEIISFGPFLLLISIAFIFSDVYHLIGNIRNGSVNKLISKQKKSMRRRLNSSHSLVFLESFSRRINASIAKSVLMIIKTNPEKKFSNDPSLLELVQHNLGASITGSHLSYVLSVLVDKGIIEIKEDSEITVLIADEIFNDNRFLSEKLILEFNLPDDFTDELHELYRIFRNLVFDICSIAGLNPPQFPEC